MFSCPSAATVFTAAQANAAEIMAAQPQEIAEIANGTPIFYVVFLVAALGFTLATVSVIPPLANTSIGEFKVAE